MTQNAIDAISQGGLYALFALGIALIFGIMRLVNFAHGELIMCGAYALVLISGPPLVIRIAASLALVVVLALAMDRIAFRPARGADASTLLITSFAVSYLLQSLAILALGATPRSTVVNIPNVELVTIATTAVLVAGLTLFLNRTRLGVEMRAAAEDFPTARLLGVRANRVIAAAFAISGLLAGVAAFLLVARTGTVTATIGLTPVLLGFIAAVLGGMNSLTGAALGGFALGVTGSILQTALPLELRPYRDAFLFGAVLAFMVVRPQGFLPGRTAVTRV